MNLHPTDAVELAETLDRFIFLLGGNDGDALFAPDTTTT
jgi:hypothetical protein